MRETLAPPAAAAIAAHRRSSARLRWAGGRAVVMTLLIGVVVAGFASLFSHRLASPLGLNGTSSFNDDFGPTVLPTGPQPQVGNWRQISLLDGIPAQSSYNFRMTPQTSVPELVCGCYLAGNPPQASEPRKLWRSGDGGRTWTALNAPAGTLPQ
jgi:hypothetical protein